MKNKVLKIIFLSCMVFLFLGLSVVFVNAQFAQINDINLKNTLNQSETLDMLIFISPQYNKDKEIISSINGYINALKEDLSWNTEIINIKELDNFYEKIDVTIETYYQKYEIKTCLMVGEDLSTPLAGDIDHMEKPSIVPWSTIGGKDGYESNKQGIISKEYKMDICISLLYPTSEKSYNSKKSQIISAFEKFSNNRANNYFSTINIFESSELNKNSKELYQNLEKYTNINYKQDPTIDDLEKSFEKYSSLYLVHGHSNPSNTKINDIQNIYFTAENLDRLNSPFFCADGCYVSGWWSNQLDNDRLDMSIYGSWYGSKIFTSNSIKIMALGLLSQNGYKTNVSFIKNILPDLSYGKTVAESMIGLSFTGDFVLYGDPSFHFVN